jgi:hypothetical protein
MNNYELSRDRAQNYFLNFDQHKILNTWNLSGDDQWLYVLFFSRTYRIDRKNGSVFRCWDETPAGFEEVLSIFDLLCHQGDHKPVSGNFAPVNSLKNGPRSGGVGTDFHTKTAALFDQNPEAFRKACLSLGGEPMDMGDLGFRFHIFGPLNVILKFYHADEDFPASLTLLWDDEILQFLYYETVFYIAGFLMKSIAEEMKQH